MTDKQNDVPICAQCESNARDNEAGGYYSLAQECREYCRRGHKPSVEQNDAPEYIYTHRGSMNEVKPCGCGQDIKYTRDDKVAAAIAEEGAKVWDEMIVIVREYERERYGKMRSLSLREIGDLLEAAKRGNK